MHLKRLVYQELANMRKNKAKESNMCVDDLIYDVEKEKGYDLALEAYIRVQGVPE